MKHRVLWILKVLTLASVGCSDASEDQDLVASTATGALRGVLAGRVEQFLGIPYAAPPVGPRRFSPPAPVEAWQGTRDASQFGASCVQQLGVLPFVDRISEDCLFLNVYRPAGTSADARLPTLVWVHGGAFTIGTGSGFDPQRLVEENGVVVVTINYRLGALGFLALPALSAEAPDGLSGDYGFMDQQSAFRWVQDNIAGFGGDPARVTIAGQSAGAASICAQLASPPAAGLFSAAIVQSGGCPGLGLEVAEQMGAGVATSLGCTDPASAAECLRQLPAEQLAVAGASLPYAPVVGGELMPNVPADAIAAGAQHRVPVLMGGVRDEVRSFIAQEYPLDAAQYLDRLAALIVGVPAEEIAVEYPLADYPEPFYALSAALNDSAATLPLGSCITATILDDLAATTTTYAYELDDPDFVWGPFAGPLPPPRGASHNTDIAYLFDPPAGGGLAVSMDEYQQELSTLMIESWGAFVRSGDPNAREPGAWPRYTADERRMLQLQPRAVGVITDFAERHHCSFWRERR